MGRFLGGDRWVWRAAGVVGALMLLVIAIEMVKPRDVLLGTSSTRAQQPITFTTLDQELCVPAVLPGGAGRVEVMISTAVPRPGMEMELRGGGQSLRATAPGPEAPGQQIYAVPLPEPWPEEADGVAGEVCVKPTGTPFTLLGAPSGPSDKPATMSGEPMPVRLSLWFRPPVGEKRSYLGELPEMFQRAATFRPGIVGPWTYWLGLVLLPLLWLAGLRLVARGGAGSTRRTAVTVGVIAFVNFTGWALITPVFDAPDEQEHYTYVQNVAERQVIPRQGPADAIFSPETVYATDATRIFTYYAVPEGRPPWTKADEQRWRATEDLEPSPRPPGIASPPATQLPPFLGPLAPASYGVLAPGYYTLATPSYLATKWASPYSRLTAARLTSALLGALTAVLAVLIVLELAPALPAAAAAAGLLVAFQPMFGFISGAVNSDNGVNLVAALVLFLLVRALRRGLTVKLAVALGAALVALPMMKTTGYSFYAVAAVGLAGILWRSRRAFSFRPWLALGGTFLALQAVWIGIVRWQVGPPPDNLVSANPDTVTAGLLDQINYAYQIFFPRPSFLTDVNPFRWPQAAFHLWVERVWGSFGWLSHLFPHWVYVWVNRIVLAFGALGAIALWRYRHIVRAHLAETVLLVVTIPIVLFAVHAGLVSLTPRTALPEQGRYLFPAITALAALAVGACAVFGRRALIPLAGALVTAMMGISFAGQLFWLTNAYA